MNNDSGPVITSHLGMALSDYYAGKALQGLLANPNIIELLETLNHNEELRIQIVDRARNIAADMVETQ